MITDLQFGFKPGVSTDSCTGLLKNTIALNLYRETKVYGCFLYASKAFDRVSHNTLFSVPHLLLRFNSLVMVQESILRGKMECLRV